MSIDPQDYDLQDQVALVAGAGLGLGRVIAEAFAARGASLAVNDITPVNLDETVERVRLAGGRVKDYVFDVGKYMPAYNLVDQVLADWSRIDVLVNHAVVRPSAALLEMDEWDWRRTLEVNLTGAFFLLQLAGRAMRKQGGGLILQMIESDVTPACALAPGARLPGLGAFAASQAALADLTRQAALELAQDNIRVNAICLPPSGGGWAGTRSASRIQQSFLDQPAPADLSLKRAEALAKEPGPKVADVALAWRSAANLALYLCSPAAAQITGQIIAVSSFTEAGTFTTNQPDEPVAISHKKTDPGGSNE